MDYIHGLYTLDFIHWTIYMDYELDTIMRKQTQQKFVLKINNR